MAVYWLALGFLLGYTYVKLIENPITPAIIINKQAENMPSRNAMGQAESHVYTGKLSTTHIKQQAK